MKTMHAYMCTGQEAGKGQEHSGPPPRGSVDSLLRTPPDLSVKVHNETNSSGTQKHRLGRGTSTPTSTGRALDGLQSPFQARCHWVLLTWSEQPAIWAAPVWAVLLFPFDRWQNPDVSGLADGPESYSASLCRLSAHYLIATTVCVVGTGTTPLILRIRKLRHGKVKNAFRTVRSL